MCAVRKTSEEQYRLDCSIQGRFRWPRNRDEARPITWKQFDWLMSGLDVEQPKALKMDV